MLILTHALAESADSLALPTSGIPITLSALAHLAYFARRGSCA